MPQQNPVVAKPSSSKIANSNLTFRVGCIHAMLDHHLRDVKYNETTLSKAYTV